MHIMNLEIQIPLAEDIVTTTIHITIHLKGMVAVRARNTKIINIITY